MPIPPAYKNDSYANPSYRLERKKYFVETGTLLLLLVYTTITLYLYRTAKDTEQVTERAYVNVESVSVVPLIIGQPLEAAVTYKNSGHTPAKELYVAPIYDIVDNPLLAGNVPIKHWLKCETDPRGTVLPPGISRTIDAATSTGRYAPRILTGKVYQRLTENDKKWVVGAKISYRDQFGHCHATFEPFWYNPASKAFDGAYVGFQQADN